MYNDPDQAEYDRYGQRAHTNPCKLVLSHWPEYHEGSSIAVGSKLQNRLKLT